MADIFLRRWFSERGPYTDEEIRAWLRDGTVSPKTLARRRGAKEWNPLSKWGTMSASVRLPRRGAPARSLAHTTVAAEEPGFDRWRYFWMNLIIAAGIWSTLVEANFFADAIQALATDGHLKGSPASWLSISSSIAQIVFLAAGIWLGMKRLQNIGWHGAWILFTFVPLLNVFFAIALVGLPPGYAWTKKLDAIAWAWFLFLCALLYFLMQVVTAPGVMEQIGRLLQEHWSSWRAGLSST